MSADPNVLFITPFLPVREFGRVTGMSPKKTYDLLSVGRITAVKNGGRTLVRETPAAFLNALPAFVPGQGRPGPGRPRKVNQ